MLDTTTARSMLDGVLLSDGSFARSHESNKCYFVMNLSGKEHMDWLWSVREALVALGVEVAEGYPKAHPAISRGKRYIRCTLASASSELLSVEASVWYRGGVKIVPAKIRLNEVSLANWFMGDGNSYLSDGLAQIQLCTQGFGIASIEALEDALHNLGFGVGRALYKKVKTGSGIGITVRKGDTDRFFDMVEPFVVPSYRYKIKRGAASC